MSFNTFRRECEDEARPFGWMPDGLFELVDRERRLYRWQTGEGLVDVTEDIP